MSVDSRAMSGWEPYDGEPIAGAVPVEGAIFPSTDGGYIGFSEGRWWKRPPSAVSHQAGPHSAQNAHAESQADTQQQAEVENRQLTEQLQALPSSSVPNWTGGEIFVVIATIFLVGFFLALPARSVFPQTMSSFVWSILVTILATTSVTSQFGLMKRIGYCILSIAAYIAVEFVIFGAWEKSGGVPVSTLTGMAFTCFPAILTWHVLRIKRFQSRDFRVFAPLFIGCAIALAVIVNSSEAEADRKAKAEESASSAQSDRSSPSSVKASDGNEPDSTSSLTHDEIERGDTSSSLSATNTEPSQPIHEGNSSSFKVAETIDERGVYMPVYEGWKLSRFTQGTDDVISLSKDGREIRVVFAQPTSTIDEELSAYPLKQEQEWQKSTADEYERVKMEPIDLDFVTAGKITGFNWEFKRRAPGEIRRHTRVWFYRWKGQNYVLWMRSQDLSSTDQADVELNEMVRLHDAR